MERFKITEAYIQLNQLLKALGWVENGAEANAVIDEGLVKVNGAPERRKRNKIRQGFRIEFGRRTVLIE